MRNRPPRTRHRISLTQCPAPPRKSRRKSPQHTILLFDLCLGTWNNAKSVQHLPQYINNDGKFSGALARFTQVRYHGNREVLLGTIGDKHVDVWRLAPTKPAPFLSRNQRDPKMACQAVPAPLHKCQHPLQASREFRAAPLRPINSNSEPYSSRKQRR